MPLLENAGTCKVCEGPAISPRSIYCADHRPASTVRSAEAKKRTRENKRNRTSAPPRERKAPTAVAAATEIVHAGEPTGGDKSKPPTAKEWKAKASLFLELLTLYLVMRIVARSDLPEAEHDAATDRLEMGDDEVEAIIDPFVGLITGPFGALNKKYGRGAVEILGVLPAVLALVTWRARVRDFERHHCPPKNRRGVRAIATDLRGTSQGQAAGPEPVYYHNGSTAPQEVPGLIVHPGTA